MASRNASSLVVVEHDNEKLVPSTLHAVTAAKQLGGDITCLIAGTNCESVCCHSYDFPVKLTIVNDFKINVSKKRDISHVMVKHSYSKISSSSLSLST